MYQPKRPVRNILRHATTGCIWRYAQSEILWHNQYARSESFWPKQRLVVSTDTTTRKCFDPICNFLTQATTRCIGRYAQSEIFWHARQLGRYAHSEIFWHKRWLTVSTNMPYQKYFNPSDEWVYRLIHPVGNFLNQPKTRCIRQYTHAVSFWSNRWLDISIYFPIGNILTLELSDD